MPMPHLPTILIAILVGMAVYILLIALMPKRFLISSTNYTRSFLNKLASEKPVIGDEDEPGSLLSSQKRSAGLFTRLFFMLPGVEAAYPRMLKSGVASNLSNFIVRCLIAMAVVSYITAKFFPLNFGFGFLAAYAYGWRHINRKIRKRNRAFLENFPDALDMIVRSVRSGYPMNSAIRMVANNTQPPVCTEFKQVADEVAYGSTMIEALQRLAVRVDEPDVQFFVVVLTVQQDIGGNLSEVLGNLSGILRKRKHLRQKILALSSEGRTTAWVLGMMPVVEAGLIYFVAPNHLTPLFTSTLGNEVLAATVGLVAFGTFIVSRMVNIKV